MERLVEGDPRLVSHVVVFVVSRICEVCRFFLTFISTLLMDGLRGTTKPQHPYPDGWMTKFDFKMVLLTILDLLLFNPTNLICLLIAYMGYKVFKFISDPMDYEMDMRSGEFCHKIAEIDNSLRLRRGIKGEYHESKENERLESVDCGTNAPKHAPAEGCMPGDNDNGLSGQFAGQGQGDMLTNITATNGTIDHVYPNGWLPVIESAMVEPGSIKRAIILGKDIIVTRSLLEKQVSVLDAYCPHMGVHIGVGGRVTRVDDKSCVECPFHGWKFRASDGQCVNIPYSRPGSKSSVPKMAKLNTWQCIEVDLFIYVWYHVNGDPPCWDIVPSKPNHWTLAGKSVHKTYLELRDMHENGADMNHFEGIHNDLFVLGSRFSNLRLWKFLQKYTRHHWRPEWKPVTDDAGRVTHIAEMKLRSWISLFNLRFFDITVNAKQIGPARVDLHYSSPWYGTGLLIMNAIPMGGRQTKYVQHIYSRSSLYDRFMAKWVLYGEIKMLERDFYIWNHKKNLKTPIFVPEDKILKQFRMWYSQFYRKRHKIYVMESRDSKEPLAKSLGPLCLEDLVF